MSNLFFAPGPHRATRVNDLFAAIADRYDLLNDLQSFGLHRRWKRRVAGLADVRPGDRALDVCCGTGDLVLALAAQGAAVVGLDFSEPMLAIARSKVQCPTSDVRSPESEAGRSESTASFATRTARFVHGDAQRLPFPDDSFDIVTVGYGLRNLASWEAGLAEMARVARPGGRLLVLDFGRPDCTASRTIYFGYLRWVVPLLGLIFCRNAAAYAYIVESLKHYPAQHGVEAKMRELGLVHLRLVTFLGGAMSINVGQKAR